MKHRLFPCVPVILAILTARPAMAVSVSGGIDPATGLTTLAPWLLSLCGIAIVLICAGKGVHAVAEGRHLGPYVGAAIGGTALCFGAAYLLTRYGVI